MLSCLMPTGVYAYMFVCMYVYSAEYVQHTAKKAIRWTKILVPQFCCILLLCYLYLV